MKNMSEKTAQIFGTLANKEAIEFLYDLNEGSRSLYHLNEENRKLERAGIVNYKLEEHDNHGLVCTYYCFSITDLGKEVVRLAKLLDKGLSSIKH